MRRRTLSILGLAAAGSLAISMVGLGARQAVHAQAPSASTRPSARFVALQPPPAGDNTYGNFLWVLDSATGDVVAYRIASVKGDDGKLEFWMTERLISEDEYHRLRAKK